MGQKDLKDKILRKSNKRIHESTLQITDKLQMFSAKSAFIGGTHRRAALHITKRNVTRDSVPRN